METTFGEYPWCPSRASPPHARSSPTGIVRSPPIQSSSCNRGGRQTVLHTFPGFLVIQGDVFQHRSTDVLYRDAVRKACVMILMQDWLDQPTVVHLSALHAGIHHIADFQRNVSRLQIATTEFKVAAFKSRISTPVSTSSATQENNTSAARWCLWL